MRIVFVSPAFSLDSTIEDFWNYGICQVNKAKALAALGHDVTVLSRFSQNASIERDGTSYRFVKDKHAAVLRSWQSSAAILKEVLVAKPDIVHFQGLNNAVFLMHVALALPKTTQIFAEYHGGAVARFPMRVLQRLSLRSIAGLLFTNAQKADQWSAELRLPRNRFHYAVECAPDREMAERGMARKRTGFHGSPVILWNSRAIPRRHPDLVIEGYDRYLQSNPDTMCQFYMMVPDYDPDMLDRIKALSVRSQLLRDHFTLIVDRKPHAAMTDYYNSADYIISGSEDDPYGYGVVDAMSCGVIPIVPRSSTFLEITCDGKVGLLWDLQNPASLVEAFDKMSCDPDEIAQLSREVLRTFDQNLSMVAQAHALERIYHFALKKGPDL